MKKDSIVMIGLACMAIGIGIGHLGSTRLPLVDKIEFSPRIELEFSKPVFWVIEKELPAPDPIIKTVVVKEEVPVMPRKFKDYQEFNEFRKWLLFNVPYMPFGSRHCGLDTDLIQKIAFAKGFVVNVDIAENARHLILNTILADGTAYGMEAIDYNHWKVAPLNGWHKYDENLWKEIVGWEDKD